ncbi:aldose 1-epimerase [Paenibacillus sp. LMG 31456]|uniref:Aldose 1-epimerase n=1 Tax=Paenibacillus foliorum TaxID=2654974 RepID=A0A972GTL2_9BACL|nr:aldose 1-epimerase [Paenibacillus foliorum]NOU96492.1 aldose 1-epimerase [Paenibacillus foliorum]
MEQASAKEISFYNVPAIELISGGYRAVIVPEIGSNMVELSRPGENLSFLRTPESSEQLRTAGQRYGIPPLFPPNRIMGGKFSTPFRDYVLPLNSSDGEHFMHGILHKRAWEIKGYSVRDDGAAQIVLHMDMGKQGEMFAYFPHEFSYELTYILSEQGLEQQVRIENYGEEPMPLGVGFHTAFRVPFHAEGQEQDYRLKVSVGEKWELTPLFVPTGTLMPLDEKDQQLLGEGIQPTGEAYASHLTSKAVERNGKSFHGAELIDTVRNISLVYEVDKVFEHWTLWNDDGQSRFICPEPQTWAINAPNVLLPDEVTGFQLLVPGAVWTATCRMYAVSGE